MDQPARPQQTLPSLRRHMYESRALKKRQQIRDEIDTHLVLIERLQQQGRHVPNELTAYVARLQAEYGDE